MALRGDLTSVGLADVFQMLALNRKQGILCINAQDTWRALYFDTRGVTLYYNEHIYLDRLLDRMVRKHFLASDVLQALRRENSGDPIGTVEVILSSGVLAEDVFLSAFREQMEEEIYDLFLWENVHWEFLEGVDRMENREGVINENFFLNSDSLVMEAARRLDEWVFIRELVPGPMEVFEPVPGKLGEAVVGLNEESTHLLEFVDGKRNVARIIELSGMVPFHACKELSEFVRNGYVIPLPEGKYLSRGEDCINEGRFDDAIHLLERGIQAGVGLPYAYLRVAQTYESQSEVARASWHYKNYASALVEARRYDDAVDTLEHCLQIVPTDLEALERLVSVLGLQEAPKHDPHIVGKELIDIYLELDETERARKVLEGLLRVRPADIELKKTLVTVHMKAGDTRRVMELYESIAEDLVKHKDPIDAVPYLQKILMIDRERHDISDRIKQLYVMDEKHRSRRRSMFMTFAALICFVAIGAFYFLYEQNVRRVFDSLDPVPYVKEGDFDGAIAMYQEFLRRYPITVLRSEVEAKIEQLQGRQALDLAHREQVSRVAQRRAMRKRREYRELYDEYVESFEKEKDLAKALLRLQRIIVLVEEAGEPEDGDFRRTMKLDAALDETKTLLEDGERLEQEIKKKLDEGDAETARKLALQMHRDFRFTPSARRTLVPIELHSEPSGAQVYRDGKPILNGDKPLVTPVLLEVPFNDRVEIQLIKKGFKQLTVSMKGSDPSPLVVAMPLKPEIVVKLEWETMTGVSLAGDIGLVGLRDGKLVGFDPRTGSQKFSLDLDVLEEVKQAPVVYEGLCVFPTTQSNLIAVSTKTGEELWRSRIEGGVENELRLRPQGNTVAFVTGSGELRVHSVTTGKLVWAYDTGKSPAASPRWDGENLLYGDGSDQLLVLSLDGQVSTQIGVSGFTVSGTPLRTHGLFVVGGTDGRVHAVNEWGTEVWSKKIGKPYSPITILEVQDGLLVLDEEGLIRKLSAKTGKFLRARRLSGPVTDLIQVKNRIYILSESDNAARIVGIDGRQLAMLWEYKVKGGVRGGLTSYEGRLVVVDNERQVHILR